MLLPGSRPLGRCRAWGQLRSPRCAQFGTVVPSPVLPGHWAFFLDVRCPSRILEETAKTKCAKAGVWRDATWTQVTNRDQRKVGDPHAMKRRTKQAEGPQIT